MSSGLPFTEPELAISDTVPDLGKSGGMLDIASFSIWVGLLTWVSDRSNMVDCMRQRSTDGELKERDKEGTHEP